MLSDHEWALRAAVIAYEPNGGRIRQFCSEG